jgi:NitT/TauT family transport system ATP-binding protein
MMRRFRFSPALRQRPAFTIGDGLILLGIAAGKKLVNLQGELPQKKLPHARLNALAGLLEKVANEGGRADLPDLGAALHFELDDLLPLVETGELLGFLNTEDGTLVLTELGQTYADASILARKELLAGRVLRLPLINWIYDTLQRDDTHSTARSYFLDKLESEFGDRAEKQLDIAIGWARHAELFAYDDDAGELYLEE